MTPPAQVSWWSAGSWSWHWVRRVTQLTSSLTSVLTHRPLLSSTLHHLSLVIAGWRMTRLLQNIFICWRRRGRVAVLRSRMLWVSDYLVWLVSHLSWCRLTAGGALWTRPMSDILLRELETPANILITTVLTTIISYLRTQVLETWLVWRRIFVWGKEHLWEGEEQHWKQLNHEEIW